jgi:hypothetical protein
VSERHAWNIIAKNLMETKKMLNQSRKKAYVKRADVEHFHQSEQDRQRLDALKPASLSEKSEMSEQKPELEMSESGPLPLSESGTALSESRKSLPALIKEMQTRQEVLQKGVVKWRVTSFWVSVLGVVVAVFLILSLNEQKTALSESRNALSERENRLSESQRALSEMSERAFALSEREKQALQTVSEREKYIMNLESQIQNGKLEEAQPKE